MFEESEAAPTAAPEVPSDVSIHIAAAELGVTPATLLLWEKAFKIKQARRQGTGARRKRVYSAAEIAAIGTQRSNGFPQTKANLQKYKELGHY